ncbi:hypothetical protein SLA2020_234240 [Shorea laevis]
MKSTYPAQFRKNMKSVRELSQGAHDDLMEIPPELWCKAFFTSFAKCDACDNNMSKAFNSWIKGVRLMRIIDLLEQIKVMVMKRIVAKNLEMSKWKGDIAPRGRKKFEQNKIEATKCRVEWNGVHHYDVWHYNDKFEVDIKHSECRCRGWNLTSAPCPHAIVVVWSSNLNLEDFVLIWYKKDNYKLAYGFPIMLMNVEDF